LVFVPFFFLVCGIAGWPVVTRHAPYMFWIVAMSIWMGGGLLAVILLQIIKAFAT
jgi:hypothetical protein